MDQKELAKIDMKLPLMENFYTIQGEGFHSGKAAYFIRLAGCDVGCTWCDVKESWNAGDHKLVSIDNMVALAQEATAKMVVITGGEPLMYDLEVLTKVLNVHGFKTHLETSGAYKLTGDWDWVCLSPKKFKQPLPEVFQKADELKVIVFNKHDFKWGEQMAVQVGKRCKLYLQPEWSKAEEMMPQIIEYVKNNPRWEISLQVHKFMNIP